MTPPRLITPDLIEDAVIDLVERRHPEHLAALERDRSVPVHIEPFRTVDLLAGEGFRLAEDDPPCVLVGIFGADREPTRTPKRTLDFDLTLAAEITVVGAHRRDTIKRRGWYTMTFIECLLARLPRHAEPVDGIQLLDFDFVNGLTREEDARTVGTATLIFGVTVRDGLNLALLPPDDSPLAPGSPGGPPASTYTPPVPWPRVQTATANAEKEPSS